MTANSGTILDGIVLSRLAYEPLDQQVSITAARGWQLVSRTELGQGGLLGSGFFNGEYKYDGLMGQAFIAIRGTEIALVFEGTVGATEWLTDITLPATIDAQYLQYAYITNIFKQFVAGFDPSKAYIFGHSLGGAMAEKFMQFNSDPIYESVTFGSPGINDFGSDDPRITNVEHEGDPVPVIPSISLNASGIEVDVDLPTVLPGFEHGSGRYYETALILDQSGLFGQHGSRSIVVGGEYTSDTINMTTGGNGVFLLGGGGADSLLGTGHDDILDGGDGSDDLRGQTGFDIIHGKASVNFLYGGLGNDKLYGGDSFDYLYGEQNDDTVYGGAGNDQIYGDIGNDYLKGESDGDKLDGGAGNDIIHGDGENDSISGGSDSDQLYGGTGTDSLYGGTENDVLIGEGGNDTLDGGTGSDTAQFLYDSVYYRVTGGLNAADFQIEALRFEQDIDRLVGIEWLQFANERVSVANYLARFAPGTPTPTPVIDPVAPADPVPPIPAPGPGLPKLYFQTQSFGEGNSGSRIVNVLVSLDKAAATDLTFLFTANSVSGLGTATAGSDFDAFYARPVTIAAGQTSVLIPVQIHGDTSVEGNEYFNGMVSNIQGALLGQGGTVDLERITIIDDDSATPTPPPPPPPPPAGPVYVTLRDASVILDESSGGLVTVFEFTVRRTGDLDQTTTVHLAAEGFGAAPADAADFEGGVFPSTTYTFSKGDPAYTFQVRVLGDVTTEANEYFQVKLDALTAGAHVIQANSVGVIMNDDGATPPPPAGGIVYVSVTPLDATKAEGTDVTYDPTDGSYSTNSDT